MATVGKLLRHSLPSFLPSRNELWGVHIPPCARLLVGPDPRARNVGKPRIELESRPDELVSIRLEFIKPMASTCTTAFNFQAQGGQTNVRWTMDGKNGFIAKAFCLFMDMDKMVGGDFEKGLAQLQAVAEAKR